MPRRRYNKSKPYSGFQRALHLYGKEMITRGSSPADVCQAVREYVELWLDEWQKDDHPHASPAPG